MRPSAWAARQGVAAATEVGGHLATVPEARVEAAVGIVAGEGEVAGARAGRHDLAVGLDRHAKSRCREMEPKSSRHLAAATEAAVEAAVGVVTSEREVDAVLSKGSGAPPRRSCRRPGWPARTRIGNPRRSVSHLPAPPETGSRLPSTLYRASANDSRQQCRRAGHDDLAVGLEGDGIATALRAATLCQSDRDLAAAPEARVEAAVGVVARQRKTRPIAVKRLIPTATILPSG